MVPNHLTTLRMTGRQFAEHPGRRHTPQEDSPAAIDGAGTISVSGGIIALWPGRFRGHNQSRHGHNRRRPRLTGAGFITSPFVFAIGTARQPRWNSTWRAVSVTPTAITIENVNQTLEIGPLGALVVNALQNVTNGTILMAGGLLTDTQRHLIRRRGIKWIAERLRHGNRPADQVRERHGEHNHGARRQPYFELPHRKQLRAGIRHRQHCRIRSATQRRPGRRKYLHLPGIGRRTGAYRRRSKRVQRPIVGLNVGSTLTPTNLVHILGVSTSRLRRGRSVSAIPGRSRYRTAPSCI